MYLWFFFTLFFVLFPPFLLPKKCVFYYKQYTWGGKAMHWSWSPWNLSFCYCYYFLRFFVLSKWKSEITVKIVRLTACQSLLFSSNKLWRVSSRTCTIRWGVAGRERGARYDTSGVPAVWDWDVDARTGVATGELMTFTASLLTGVAGVGGGWAEGASAGGGWTVEQLEIAVNSGMSMVNSKSSLSLQSTWKYNGMKLRKCPKFENQLIMLLK